MNSTIFDKLNTSEKRTFEKIKSIFNKPFTFFDKLIEYPLLCLILESQSATIDKHWVKNIVERYYNTSSVQSKNDKMLKHCLDIVLKTTCVQLYAESRGYLDSIFCKDAAAFPSCYYRLTQFQNLDETELNYLLKFRNWMRIALEIIPAVNNKGILIRIAGALEGSGNEYITGSGQTDGTTRRVIIYEVEGRVVPKKRTGEGNKKRDCNGEMKSDHSRPVENSRPTKKIATYLSNRKLQKCLEMKITPDAISLTSKVQSSNQHAEAKERLNQMLSSSKVIPPSPYKKSIELLCNSSLSKTDEDRSYSTSIKIEDELNDNDTSWTKTSTAYSALVNVVENIIQNEPKLIYHHPSISSMSNNTDEMNDSIGIGSWQYPISTTASTEYELHRMVPSYNSIVMALKQRTDSDHIFPKRI